MHRRGRAEALWCGGFLAGVEEVADMRNDKMAISLDLSFLGFFLRQMSRLKRAREDVLGNLQALSRFIWNRCIHLER